MNKSVNMATLLKVYNCHLHTNYFLISISLMNGYLNPPGENFSKRSCIPPPHINAI